MSQGFLPRPRERPGAAYAIAFGLARYVKEGLGRAMQGGPEAEITT